MESDKLDVTTICRTCMCESTNMKSVFYKLEDERCVNDLLEYLTNISINSDDNLPKQVCDKCERFLHTAAYFKQRCLDVESKLKKLLKNEACTSFSEIKHEGTSEEITLDTHEPYQCSICFNKYSDTVLLQNHVYNFHRVKKVFNELTLFSNAKADLVTLETISEKDENEVIKEEFNDTIDQDSQFDNDYSEHDSESVLILFPPENKDETKMTIEINNKAIDNLLKKEHECENSNQQFKSANSLNIHIRKHNEIDKKYQCSLCMRKFISKSGLTNHLRVHESKDDVKYTNKHNEHKEIEKKYQCSLCMRKFISKSGLTNHLRVHESKDDVKYTCGSCKREFKHKAHLDNHMITLHANEKGFSCDYCPKTFATQESLEIHKDLHKIDKKHSCQYCNKAFYMLSTLTDHIRTHTGEKPYLCSTCGRGFSQKTNLAQHMRRHLGLKPFACEICTQRFVSKGELVAHTRKHSGAHPFICDECGNGFTTSSSLVKHRRTHSGERPYACDLCHMRFAASGTLKNHRRTHTGEKPYQCSHCEKAFVQKNDLVSHVRCHTGERPFVCNVCGSAFRKPAALRSHAKMHARDKELMPY